MAAEVVRQWPALTNGKYAGFFPGVIYNVGNVTRREDIVVGFCLQGVRHPDKATVVQGQAGIPQPLGAAGTGDPEHFVNRQGVAGLRGQTIGLDL